MDFVSIDLETADSANSRPCSIGLAFVKDDVVIDKKYYLVNPEVSFNPVSSRIHGITADTVSTSPTFPEIWSEILPVLRDSLIVSHNAAFDLGVIEKVANHYGLQMPNVKYICTMQLAKEKGYESLKLSHLCDEFGIPLSDHHNALCDAVACANLMISLCSVCHTTSSGASIPSATVMTNTVCFDLDEFERSCLRVLKGVIESSGIDYSMVRYKKSKTLDIDCYKRVIRIGTVRKKRYIEIREKYIDLVSLDLPHDQTKSVFRFYLDSPDDLKNYDKYILHIIQKSKSDWDEYVQLVSAQTSKKHLREFLKTTGDFMTNPEM